MKFNCQKVGIVIFVSSIFSTAALAETKNGFSSPESILYDKSHFYVSNVGEKLEPTAKDGDGYISLVDMKGNIKEKKYFDAPLNAPKGMAIYDNILYVTDISSVIGFDIKTRNKVFQLSLKEKNVNFLNDIAVDDNGVLYVSATDTGDIYKINTRVPASEIRATRLPIKKIPGPNGLAYDGQTHTLWVASFGFGKSQKGELGKVDIASLSYEKVTNISGMFDGIAIVGPHTVLVSDWVDFDGSGKIIEVDINAGSQKILVDKIGGPADFAYLSKSKQLVIPRMIEGSISIERLP